jgi:hypothetical protein
MNKRKETPSRKLRNKNMNRRLSQFDLRENTASPRQHASRPAVSTASETTCEARPYRFAIPRSPLRATPTVDSESAVDTRTNEISYLAPEDRGQYEFLDCKQLAERWNVPETWIRERVRRRSQDPLPHVRFGKYVRFRWGAPELEDWAERRIVTGSNRKQCGLL